MQSHIILTGHIVDHLNTIISGSLWDRLSEEDREIFVDVMQEAAERATRTIQQREAELVDQFRQNGLEVIEVDTSSFETAVRENVGFEEFGYREVDWDAIRALAGGAS